MTSGNPSRASSLATRLLVLGALAVLCGCRAGSGIAAAPGVAADPGVAFVDVAVVPMDAERVLRGYTVLVRDDRIVGLGPSRSTTVPPGASRIDGRGRYLIPGLADMHAHVEDTTELILDLASGVTLVRNLEGDSRHLEWRRRIAAGELLGPAMVTAGPFVNLPRIKTPADARRAVEQQQEAGYDELKVHGDLDPETYDTLIATARRVGLPVVGHIPRTIPLRRVLAGQAEVSHAEEFLYSDFFRFDTGDSARRRIPEVAAMVRRAGVTVTPTLVTYRRIVAQVADLDSLLRDTSLAYVTPWNRALWQRENNRYVRNFAPERLPVLRARYAFQAQLVRSFHDAGVPLLLGSDAIGPVWVPGWAAQEELSILVGLGISPYEALRTATTNPAVFLGAEREFGTIRPGQRADLVLLAGNPLVDITNVRRVEGVMVRGRWLSPERLHQLMDGVLLAHRREQQEVDAMLARGFESAATRLCDSVRSPLSSDAESLLDLEVTTRFAGIIRDSGPAGALGIAERIQRSCPRAVVFSERKVNDLAAAYRRSGRLVAAIEVLRLNQRLFPESFLAAFWLGEAALVSGDTTTAVTAYRRSLELNQYNLDARDRLRQLGLEPK
jgi:imidazolonepropionase-like amidohydrolase